MTIQYEGSSEKLVSHNFSNYCLLCCKQHLFQYFDSEAHIHSVSTFYRKLQNQRMKSLFLDKTLEF